MGSGFTKLPASVNVPASRGRRDFYKMGLVNGDMTISYGDKTVEIKDTVLFFVNPHVPHAVVRRSKKDECWLCLSIYRKFYDRQGTGPMY